MDLQLVLVVCSFHKRTLLTKMPYNDDIYTEIAHSNTRAKHTDTYPDIDVYIAVCGMVSV